MITWFLPKARSENGYGFYMSSLKSSVENCIFWSEIGSGFEEPGGTPAKNYPGVPPAPGVSRTFVELCMETPLVSGFGAPIERFHSRGQHLCKFIGTRRPAVKKESVCIRKEFNFGTPTWPPWRHSKQSHFSVKALSFRSRTSFRAHINISSNTWNGLYCWKSREETFFKATVFLFWCDALWKRGRLAALTRLYLIGSWKCSVVGVAANQTSLFHCFSGRVSHTATNITRPTLDH